MSRPLDYNDMLPQPERIFLDEHDGDETKIDSRFAPCSPLGVHHNLEGFRPGSDLNRGTQQSNRHIHESVDPSALVKLPFRPWHPTLSRREGTTDWSESTTDKALPSLKSRVDGTPNPIEATVTERSEKQFLSQEPVSNNQSLTEPKKFNIGGTPNQIGELSSGSHSDARTTTATMHSSVSDQKQENIEYLRASRRTAVIKELIRRSMKDWAAIQRRGCVEEPMCRTTVSQSVAERSRRRAPSLHKHLQQGSLDFGNERSASLEGRWEADLMASMQLSGPVSESSSARLEIGSRATMKSFFTENAGDSRSSTSSTAESASSSPSSTPGKRSSNQQTNNSRNTMGQKDEDYEEEHGRPPKKSKSEPKSTDSDVQLLACPYWKLDPHRYSQQNLTEKNYRGCSSCYLTDISRLKQHLYRVHQRPKNLCPRCSTLFVTSQDLDSHVRATVACDARESAFPERFSESQYKDLKRRWPRENMTESWMRIWKILFPDVPCPDCPYIEDSTKETSIEASPTSNASGFIADFRTKAPGMLQEILQDLVPPHHTMTISNWLQTEEASFVLEESVERLLHRIAPSMSTRKTITPPESADLQLSDFTWIDDFYDLPQFDVWDDCDFAIDHQNQRDEDSADQVSAPVVDVTGEALNTQILAGDVWKSGLEGVGPENTSPSPGMGSMSTRRNRRRLESTRSARVA